MLRNSFQYIASPTTTQHDLVQSTSSATVKKPCAKMTIGYIYFLLVSLWTHGFKHILYVTFCVVVLIDVQIVPLCLVSERLPRLMGKGTTPVVFDFLFLVWQDVPDSSFIFLVADPKSVFSPRNPSSFEWEMICRDLHSGPDRSSSHSYYTGQKRD